MILILSLEIRRRSSRTRLLMMCDIHTGLGSDPDGDTFPKVFKTDAAPYIIMFLIGLTNGYFSTLCMMYGPG